MPEVTLEDLGRRFDAAMNSHRAQFYKKWPGSINNLVPTPRDKIATMWAGVEVDPANHLFDDDADLVLAAKLYVIARDQGLEAAMLWRLENG